MTSQFRELHKKGDPFVLANVWDAGSAKVMAALGAPALATSSAAHAFTLGRPDMGGVNRDEALAHAQSIIAATNLPVSGDFENGFGSEPDTVEETVRLSSEIGLAGISIEDTDLPGTKAYPRELAIERIKAASAAARACTDDFVLVARADGLMNGAYDLEEAIIRIKAFDAAGADCLYIPVLPDLEAVRQVCALTTKPVNILAVGTMSAVSKAELAMAGAARISLGSALARVLHKSLVDVGESVIAGDFAGLKGASGNEIDALLEKGTRQ